MRFLVFVLLIFGVAGCDSVADGKETKRESLDKSQAEQVAHKEPDLQLLKSRSEERWSMMIKRDFNAVYMYYSPERRKFLSVESFKATVGGSVDWQSADVKNTSVEGKKGQVEVQVHYKPRIPNMPMDDDFNIPKTLTEKWYWDGLNWWYAEEAKRGV